MKLDALTVDRLRCGNAEWAGANAINAHHAMQVHLECRVGDCAAKTAAYHLLCEKGRIKPDLGRRPNE